MTTEVEPTDSSNQNEENNKIDYAKLDKNELIKSNPFVIDLLVKFEVLKKGMVEERKKTSLLVSKIKQLEEELNSKTNEIKRLTQEKENNAEQKPENPNIPESTNQNEGDKQSELALFSAKEEIKKLNEQLINLKLEQENTNNKMKKTTEETEDLKKEYQTQIKLLSQANDSLLKEVKSLKTEKSDLEKEITKLQEEIKTQSLTPPPEMVREREILIREKDRLLIEKEHFEAMLNDYKKSKEEAIQQLEESQKKIKELSEDNNQLKEAKLSLESNAGKMALKLTDYKNMVMEMNLRNQVFHVKKAGLISHNEIDIIFYKNKDGVYVMRIDEKNNSDFINILDVESVNQSDKKKNKVDISYMHKSKKFNLSVLVNELVIDQFVDAYKNFYSESMKSQNKVGY
jgi:chromosome segregation ATPase